MDLSQETAILNEFLQLDQGGKIQAEYIWIGGSGHDLRSKTRVQTLHFKNIYIFVTNITDFRRST